MGEVASRENSWLHFNAGKGEACPAFGWKNIIQRALAQSGLEDKNLGVGIVVFGGRPENIASVSFGNLDQVNLVQVLAKSLDGQFYEDISELRCLENAYYQMRDQSRPALAKLGAFVVERDSEKDRIASLGLAINPEISNNLRNYSEPILRGYGVELSQTLTTATSV